MKRRAFVAALGGILLAGCADTTATAPPRIVATIANPKPSPTPSVPTATPEGSNATIAALVATAVQQTATAYPPAVQQTIAAFQATATPLGTTASGSVLADGQTWRQADWDITLQIGQFAADSFVFHLYLRNKTSELKIFSYRLDNVSVIDERFRIVDRYQDPSTPGKTNDQEKDAFAESVSIPPMSAATLPSAHHVRDEGFAIVGPFTDASVGVITILVHGMSTIADARWRVPISH